MLDSVDLLRAASIEVVVDRSEKLDAAAEMIGQVEFAIADLDGSLETFDSLSANEKAKFARSKTRMRFSC